MGKSWDIDYENYDYRQELKIDLDNLHMESLVQSELYMKYAEAEADSRHDFDVAVKDYERLKVKKRIEVAKYPEKYFEDDKKPTQTMIDAIVEDMKEVSRAYDEVLECKKRKELMERAVKAFEMRKSSIKNLVNLHGQGYYSVQVGSQERKMSQEITEEKALERMRNRKRND